MAEKTEVLVVGAGPTGLLLAVELAAQKIRVRIVDKAPEPSIKSKALVVQVRTLEIFERIGVISQTLKRGRPLDGLSVQAEGNKIIDIRFEEIDSPYPFPLILEQSENEAILNEKLNSYGVYVERGVELLNFQDSAHGVQTALKHADGRMEGTHTQWLIGCDGAHSAVRHLLDYTFKGKNYLQQFVLADIAMEWPLGQDKLYIFVSKHGFMAVAPLPHDKLFRLITTENNLSLDHDPTIPELQAFADRLLPFKTKISPGTWTARFKIACRKVEKFGQGHVFLAGDAAHIHSPAGGLGMNTGLQDAYNLAWKLPLICQGHATPRLLESYAAEREPIAKTLLRTTDRLFFLVGGGVSNPLLKMVQRYFLPSLFRFGPIRRTLLKAVSQLGIHYRKSPLTLRDFHADNGAVKAGYRLPNFDLIRSADEKTISLWQVIEARVHHILLIGNALGSASHLSGVTSIPHAIHFLNLTGNPAIGENAYIVTSEIFQKNFGQMNGQLRTIIVRPDGYVGADLLGHTAEKIAAYFSNLSKGV